MTDVYALESPEITEERLRGDNEGERIVMYLRVVLGDGNELAAWLERAQSWPEPRRRAAIRKIQKALERAGA